MEPLSSPDPVLQGVHCSITVEGMHARHKLCGAQPVLQSSSHHVPACLLCRVDEALDLVKELARCHGHMQVRMLLKPLAYC